MTVEQVNEQIVEVIRPTMPNVQFVRTQFLTGWDAGYDVQHTFTVSGREWTCSVSTCWDDDANATGAIPTKCLGWNEDIMTANWVEMPFGCDEKIFAHAVVTALAATGKITYDDALV